ncbi:ScaI family restriction endonuclease [Paracidovorax valerianellae]|uniref:ScaI restriction endonuclease n=1 Tax=Paracidovorax valerianellae TaxID=187868 RepID=A0A1G6P910_9BURK|nr:ScaI family restriction endonuclease [Paracidovorax valerianellae]MDA8444815.1 ScaI family restriction endonuclease [Paracidovorax valerianellae]SDC76613.1 ScaI restriction endonuclease [Paracidovorax valerianellae]
MVSPYFGRPVDEWSAITHQLVQSHPLTRDLILEAATLSWTRLWNTWVGDAIVGFPIAEIDPPATVIGYMFEKLFAKELAKRLPGAWRGGIGSEKDLHCLQDQALSVEMKASGQLGYKIFGNRSYGQVLENADAAKKDKSGYYITVNFYGQTLTLLRFGWIDASDWQAQKSATGQMAGLPSEVYEHKLLPIFGPYMLEGSVLLLEGVGARAAGELSAAGVKTIGNLIRATNLPIKYQRLQVTACERYQDLY